MEQNQENIASLSKTGAKDFFLNVGALISFYTIIGSVINILFTAINSRFSEITPYTYSLMYYGASSISWPVAMTIILFPIFLTLMWLLGKEYRSENGEKKYSTIHKWIAYLTIFLSGSTIAGSLISVVYYFIDGQDITTSFLLKILVMVVVGSSVFLYYISEIRNKITEKERMLWRILASVLVLGSIAIGFLVLGSPRTQRLYKYDTQKLENISNIKYSIENYVYSNNMLPAKLEDINDYSYRINTEDPQTKQKYEYIITGENTYQLCAVFNKATPKYDNSLWRHPEGRHCFDQSVKIEKNLVETVKMMPR